MNKLPKLVTNPQVDRVYRIAAISPESSYYEDEPLLLGKLVYITMKSLSTNSELYAVGVSGLITGVFFHETETPPDFHIFKVSLKRVTDYTEARYIASLKKRGILPWTNNPT